MTIGWKEYKCAELFEQVSTTKLKVKTKDCNPIGKYPVVDQGREKLAGFIDDEKRVISVSSPVCIFGDHTRVIKWIDFDFVPGADGTKILSPKSIINPRFFYYLLQNIPLIDKGYARHFKQLKEASVRVPEKNEQKRIADKLDSVLAKVEAAQARLDKIPAILKRFRQSVLAAATSGELTKEWRENAGISEMNWSSDLLKNITYSISDGDHQAPPRANNGIPFLVISNVSKGKIEFSKVTRWVPHEYFEKLKSIRKPERGDILYTVTGSFGIPIVVDTDKPFCFQRHIAILKPDLKRVSSSYLSLWLESPLVFKHAGEVATGTAQKTVSLSNLRKFQVSVPPLDEQAKIVESATNLFTKMDSVKKQYVEARERLDKLTQSILAKAFKGELLSNSVDSNIEAIENSIEALNA